MPTKKKRMAFEEVEKLIKRNVRKKGIALRVGASYNSAQKRSSACLIGAINMGDSRLPEAHKEASKYTGFSAPGFAREITGWKLQDLHSAEYAFEDIVVNEKNPYSRFGLNMAKYAKSSEQRAKRKRRKETQEALAT